MSRERIAAGPTTPPAKLEQLWRKKLAESGFEDLEGADRDAPLSSRGKLHDAGASEDFGLPHRIEHGEAYADWAAAVEHELPEYRNTRRRMWERHARGQSMKQIAREMGTSFHAAWSTIHAIEREHRCAKPNLSKILRRVSSRALAQMAAALSRGL